PPHHHDVRDVPARYVAHRRRHPPRRWLRSHRDLPHRLDVSSLLAGRRGVRVDSGLQAAHPRSKVSRRIVDRSFTFGTTIGGRVSVLSGLSDLVRRQLLGSELLRSRFRRGRLRGRWFLGGGGGRRRVGGGRGVRGRWALANRSAVVHAILDWR